MTEAEIIAPDTIEQIANDTLQSTVAAIKKYGWAIEAGKNPRGAALRFLCDLDGILTHGKQRAGIIGC